MSQHQQEPRSLIHFPSNKALIAKQRLLRRSSEVENKDAGNFLSDSDQCASSLLFEVIEELSCTSVEHEEVETVLKHFGMMNHELTGSYQNLEKRVHLLKEKLLVETEQKRQELKEKEALASRLSTLLELLPAGVIVLDGKGVVSECNPASKELLGEPLEGQVWVNIIDRCFSPRSDDGHEVSLKDGRRVRIETRSMKNMPGQLILLSDLTETRALQAQVSRAERLTSLGKMMASLAHQIRTPLSAAMLYAGHLCQPVVSQDMREKCAEKLMSRLIHLERQIRDMLIFAKGETRLAEQIRMSHFLPLLVQAAESPVKNALAKVTWEDCSNDVSILCNREALIGALLNLINNSIDAAINTPEIIVRLVSSGSGFVNIEVIDNGPGFPDEDKDKILEPFYTTKSHGTGLGLAVVQSVVHAHHGKFYISSLQTVDSDNSLSRKTGVRAVMTLPVCASVSDPENRVKENNHA